MVDKPRLMKTIESFILDPAAATPPGEAYQTGSGAIFAVEKDGTVKVLKSTGCMGCDFCWPETSHDGHKAHFVNPTSIILCTKATEQSGRTMQ